jgi:hypothetical protein
VDGLFIVGPGSATDWSPRLSRLLAAAKTAGAGHAVLLSARAVEFLPEAAGIPVRYEDESDDDHVQRLRAAGTPEGYIQWRMAMLGGIRRGDDAYLSDGVQQVLGRPATSLAAWARREVPVAPWARAATAARA